MTDVCIRLDFLRVYNFSIFLSEIKQNYDFDGETDSISTMSCNVAIDLYPNTHTQLYRLSESSQCVDGMSK